MGSDTPSEPTHPPAITRLSNELTSFSASRPLAFHGLSAEYELVPQTRMVAVTATFYVPLETGHVRAGDISEARAALEDEEDDEPDDTEPEEE